MVPVYSWDCINYKRVIKNVKNMYKKERAKITPKSCKYNAVHHCTNIGMFVRFVL